ncbi:SPOR domain-containing protein [Desulfitobacterium sp.]|uniref:SPOR domain-containing protein n=1 Tax=Desulfitobacterium sp. TaxID=49981 RepID=UPI002BAF5FE7|nr:SPOR domain-containing protein [Desulfitobacterium sp.]HVJ49803.1 SPOR domain-containing protein [Desulfitobacterium sp.]
MRSRVHWRVWGLVLIGSFFLVWMTVYLGNTYIKMLTQPKTSLSQSATGSASATEILVTLTEIDYWTCQVGVYETEENARLSKSRLEKLGWETQIVKPRPWSVTIGFAHGQEELATLRDLLKEGGIENVVKHFVVPGQAYRITGTGTEQTAQILVAVQNFLKTTPGRRGDTLSVLEKEISTSWPQKLDQLHQAIDYVLKAERTLDSDSQRLAALKLLAEYQNTLKTIQE